MAENQSILPGNEEWRNIPGWGGTYQVSNHGRVRSVDREVRGAHGSVWTRKGVILKLHKEWSGHMTVKLRSDSMGKKNMKVHQMVLSAFVGPLPDGKVTRHLNGDPSDNRLANLKYGTYQENLRDRQRHENTNTQCSCNHPLEEPNLIAHRKRKGILSCLACERARLKIRRNPELKPFRDELADECFQEITSA